MCVCVFFKIYFYFYYFFMEVIEKDIRELFKLDSLRF